MKKRIVTSCRDADLTIRSARMRLQREYTYRLIQVDTVWLHGPCPTAVITISTAVGLNGSRSDTVTITALASNDNDIWNFVIMRGRETVPLEDLTAQLKDTLREQEQVVRARKAGCLGPYLFKESIWEDSSTFSSSPDLREPEDRKYS